MKFLKNLSVAIIIFLMVISIISIQFIGSFNSIVFSKDYIEKSFDEKNIGALVTNEIINNKKVTEYITKDTNKQKILLQSMNKEWINEQNPILIKGIYRYLIGDEDTLPIINIEPVKNNIVNITIDEALKEYNVLLIPYIKEKVKSAVYSSLKIDKVSNTLDINILSEKLTSSGENPFYILRNLLGFIHRDLVVYLGIDVFLLFILLMIVRSNVFSCIKWSGTALILSGIAAIVSSLLYKNTNNYAGVFDNWIREILEEVCNKVTISGVTSIVMGIIMIFISSHFIKKSKNMKILLNNWKKVLIIAVLIILLGLINIKIYNNTLIQLKSLSEAFKNSDLGSAIIESTGAEFLR